LNLSTVDTEESIDSSDTGKSQRGNSVFELHVIVVWQRLIVKTGGQRLIGTKGPCLCQRSRNISLTAFSNPEKQSQLAEMTGLGIWRRHGGKELGPKQRHGVKV
jgi:hypothetical protein